MNLSSWFGAGVDSRLQVLWDDGERVFCRRSRVAGDGDAMLAVVPASDPPTPRSLDRLAHDVRRRATFDLNCPQDQIRVVEIESPANTSLGALGSWGVRGCGRQATYMQDRQGSTTVVMNSPIREDPSNK